MTNCHLYNTHRKQFEQTYLQVTFYIMYIDMFIVYNCCLNTPNSTVYRKLQCQTRHYVKENTVITLAFNIHLLPVPVVRN